jgi:hypothetical protein
MTVHLDQRLWTSEDGGQEYIHVLWGDTVYTGRTNGMFCAFDKRLPPGAIQLVHDYFYVPPPSPDYTLAA